VIVIRSADGGWLVAADSTSPEADFTIARCGLWGPHTWRIRSWPWMVRAGAGWTGRRVRRSPARRFRVPHVRHAQRLRAKRLAARGPRSRGAQRVTSDALRAWRATVAISPMVAVLAALSALRSTWSCAGLSGAVASASFSAPSSADRMGLRSAAGRRRAEFRMKVISDVTWMKAAERGFRRPTAARAMPIVSTETVPMRRVRRATAPAPPTDSAARRAQPGWRALCLGPHNADAAIPLGLSYEFYARSVPLAYAAAGSASDHLRGGPTPSSQRSLSTQMRSAHETAPGMVSLRRRCSPRIQNGECVMTPDMFIKPLVVAFLVFVVSLAVRNSSSRRAKGRPMK